IDLGADLAPSAGVVRRLAQIAREGRVDDDPGVPRPRLLRRDPHRHLQTPGCPAVVEASQLLGCEAPPEPAPQLGPETVGSPLEHPQPLGRRPTEATLTLLPLVVRALERHAREASSAPRY